MKQLQQQLHTKKTELVAALHSSTSKQVSFFKLESDIEQMKNKITEVIQVKDDEIQDVKKQLANAQLKSSTVKQWLDEDKNRFMTELNVLLDNNIALQTSCSVLQERLRVLSTMEKKLKNSMSEDVEVDGIFVANNFLIP